MSTYYWEAQWIRKRIQIAPDITIETCYDLTSGLYTCPLCVDISKLCPSYDKPNSVSPPENVAYFFSLQDLLRHMYAHRESAWRTTVISEEEEEEALEEIGEEEEEEH